MCVGHLITKTL
jgi:hypothetical protein